LKGQVSDVEVKLEAERKWVEKVQGALKLRVYTDDCDTVILPRDTTKYFVDNSLLIY
jgi:hypothetical protein